tara:strand:+ start:568 stop:1719 length:1152 start_codon:yes stop_codon:yes gene_type:complete
MDLQVSNVLELIKNQKYKEAISDLNELVKENKNNINYYHLRGISNLKLSNFDLAINDFNQLIKLKPDFPDVYNNLGVVYFLNGENELAIQNFHKAIELKEDFILAKNGLIKALCYKNSTTINNSNIFENHNEINKIKVEYSSGRFIEDSTIVNFLDKSIKAISKQFEKLEYDSTQIYRRDLLPLNCKRHKKIFNTHKIIPEFCFGCYKVQIEPENIIDLIKLYILFDNIFLTNTRKCMIELRPNVQGNYKGLVYCRSIEEAENVQKKIIDQIELNFNKKLPIKIKRGCTEYGVEYPQYTNLDDNIMYYKPDWKNYEILIDNKFPHLTHKKVRPTIKGSTLHDILVIRNWIYFAKLNKDEKIDLVTSQLFESNYIRKQFSLKSS